MVLKTKAHQTTRPGGLVGVILRTAFRVIQLIIALVIAGIYGEDLRKAHDASEPADSRWVFAEVVAGLSIITAIVYLVPMVRSVKFFAWDAVLLYVLSSPASKLLWLIYSFQTNSLFWLILFGIYGKLYIHEDCEGIGACKRMKTAVWFDMLGMIFWFFSAVGKCHRHTVLLPSRLLIFYFRRRIYVLERTTQQLNVHWSWISRLNAAHLGCCASLSYIFFQ